jgi:hypothetical protein
MFGSSKLWGPYQHPHSWHSRAGGGAVHSIRSGQMHRGKLHLQSITLDLCQGRFEGKLLYTGDFAICANEHFERG